MRQSISEVSSINLDKREVLLRTSRLIEKNISDDTYGVGNPSFDMNTSRSTFLGD
ncbi:hypothetical protein [Zobellia uliginosa]|uniref:hypothetical protein n=1 Tax=Zobellia uliginosa TaxID=143224 RepID=UPI0026E20479|nr:hypothetical protein [Zobellia uliginosa]MDO6516971.1 hypothetical protein [Zobellia uliginosa]